MNGTSFQVSGMTCGHCEAAVRDELEAVDGVIDVAVDHRSGTLKVTGTASETAVIDAVARAGYLATQVS